MMTQLRPKPPYLPEISAHLSRGGPAFPTWQSPDHVAEARKAMANIMRPQKEAILTNPELIVEDCATTGPRGEIIVSILSPKNSKLPKESLKPGIFYVHGGGMVLGDRFTVLEHFVQYVTDIDAVVVSVEYGLAPEHKGLALAEDSLSALRWFEQHSQELGVDSDRIMIAGISGGGGIAAGTALVARDLGGPKLCGQMLIAPMLDDRNATVSAQQFAVEEGLWDSRQNQVAWTCVLGEQAGQKDISSYIVPARATDLAGMPPTFIDVGGSEPFRDEAIDYAKQLSACGVQTDLHVWGGGCHGFDMFAPDNLSSKLAQQARKSWVQSNLQR